MSGAELARPRGTPCKDATVMSKSKSVVGSTTHLHSWRKRWLERGGPQAGRRVAVAQLAEPVAPACQDFSTCRQHGGVLLSTCHLHDRDTRESLWCPADARQRQEVPAAQLAMVAAAPPKDLSVFAQSNGKVLTTCHLNETNGVHGLELAALCAGVYLAVVLANAELSLAVAPEGYQLAIRRQDDGVPLAASTVHHKHRA
mmetsp:Transcript_2440/g.8708  ORF Transcript_2440/g.8708 Transcript_2440/m.8708 type:complete len:200 (+) Transcript_2440:2352-2951(+)